MNFSSLFLLFQARINMIVDILQLFDDPPVPAVRMNAVGQDADAGIPFFIYIEVIAGKAGMEEGSAGSPFRHRQP